MELFIAIFFKILPLYVTIALGFIAAKLLGVTRESVAKLLIYVLGTVVVFKATLGVKLDMATLILPLFLYLFSSFTVFLGLYIFKKRYKNSDGNILAFSCATGNTGYFGIPLAMIFFPPHLVDIFIFMLLASFLYESSSGFYVVAKGNLSAKEAIYKMLKLPPIYAFFVGIIFNLLAIEIPQNYLLFMENFKSTYGILGMMMIGFGLVGFKLKGDMDFGFLSRAFIAKFIYFPLVILIAIYIDKTYFMILNEELYRLALIYSIVPLAGNSVTYAVLFNANPQKISFAVVLSTIFSLFYIPFVLYLYGGFY